MHFLYFANLIFGDFDTLFLIFFVFDTLLSLFCNMMFLLSYTGPECLKITPFPVSRSCLLNLLSIARSLADVILELEKEMCYLGTGHRLEL